MGSSYNHQVRNCDAADVLAQLHMANLWAAKAATQGVEGSHAHLSHPMVKLDPVNDCNSDVEEEEGSELGMGAAEEDYDVNRDATRAVRASPVRPRRCAIGEGRFAEVNVGVLLDAVVVFSIEFGLKS